MKKILSILVFLLVVNYSFVYAQKTDRKYSIQINPLMVAGDIIMGATDQETYYYSLCLEFQYAINNHWNIFVRPYFSVWDGMNGFDFMYLFKEETETDKAGRIFSIMPGILYRPFGTGLKGMYIGLYPNIGWKDRRDEKTNTNDKYFLLGIGFEAGYEWIFNNGFTITLGGGLDRNWGIGFDENKMKYNETKGRLWDAHIAFFLGYSF
jgi:hypothetical protein